MHGILENNSFQIVNETYALLSITQGSWVLFVSPEHNINSDKIDTGDPKLNFSYHDV